MLGENDGDGDIASDAHGNSKYRDGLDVGPYYPQALSRPSRHNGVDSGAGRYELSMGARDGGRWVGWEISSRSGEAMEEEKQR